YLHWALPDALTRGVNTATNTEFPPIPDRWLVVRFYPSSRFTGRRSFRGWVLPAGDENPLPVDLDKWIEPGKKSLSGADKKFTAMGHGDASWAAYYDNVVNRLAFYDDLQGVGSGPLAYLVCGWFADPADDPLGQKWVKSL